MLGSMVFKYLSSVADCQVETTNHRWPTAKFKNYLMEISGDVIVNCIGAVPQRTSSFDINFELPIWLDKNAGCNAGRGFWCNVVHAGTDCEADDDAYGLSKRKAFNYLRDQGGRTKVIKCSIIGPELTNKQSLLEWFLSSEGEVHGYSQQMWNGITTLQWAKICWRLIKDYQSFPQVTIPYSECISKFTLLDTIKDVYDKDITIHENDKIKIDKCLKGDLPTPSIREQLVELKEVSYDRD